MVWTTPRTWVTGEVVTAGNFNVHLRDNLNAVDQHTHTGAAGDGDDELTGVDIITLDQLAAPAAPGANLSRLYALTTGAIGLRVGTAGAAGLITPSAKGGLISYGTEPGEVAVGADETVLVADAGETLGIKWGVDKLAKVVEKTADETVNNSATLQADDHLLFATGTNETWVILYVLRIVSTTVADFKFGLTIPSGADESSAMHGSIGVGFGASFGNQTAGVGGESPVFVYATVRIAGTSGNITLKWGQATAETSNTQVKQRSCLIAWKA